MSGDTTPYKGDINSIAKIQEILNSDEVFRKDFVADPVEMLKQIGFPMSKDMRNSLRAFSRQSKRNPSLRGFLKL